MLYHERSLRRAVLLPVLTGLSAADWQRIAPDNRTKAERAQTVLHFAQHMVQHEQTHLQQMRRIVRALNQ